MPSLRINRSVRQDPVVYDWPHIKVKTLVLGVMDNNAELFRKLAQ